MLNFVTERVAKFKASNKVEYKFLFLNGQSLLSICISAKKFFDTFLRHTFYNVEILIHVEICIWYPNL